jgi:hypothetical protein
MSGLSLFDALLGSAEDGGGSASSGSLERMQHMAERLIEGVKTDLKELETLDSDLATSDPEKFDMQVAAILRGMYDQWAREAEGVLERVSLVKRMGGKVGGAEELRDQHGRVRAMLSVTLKDLAEARRQLQQGRTHSLEEVRRVIRSRNVG